MSLIAKNQICVFRIGAIPETAFGLGGEKEEFRVRTGSQKGLPVLMDMQIKILPVIHPGAAEVLLVK